MHDEEYLPLVLKLIREAKQTIMIAMYAIPDRKTTRQALNDVRHALTAAVRRGVNVYMVLNTPAAADDALNESHSELAEEWRELGIDVRLATPMVRMHDKMMVVDLKKVLVGSHNWSEEAITGRRVYESSAYLELSEPEQKLAEGIMGIETISDMRSRENWENEITLIRHLDAMSPSQRGDWVAKQP